jgi:hypothetical protein
MKKLKTGRNRWSMLLRPVLGISELGTHRVSHPLANLLTLSGQFSSVVSEALFVRRLKNCKLFVCDMEKRSSYSAGFKLKVIDNAEKTRQSSSRA